MELVQGGELFTLLHNEEFIETVDESSVRFYSANAVLGLQHMHKYDFAYRDLKPENLLITKEGYLKFVDFGFAKKIPFSVINSEGVEELHSRTYTLCGTLEYLAPEFVLNTGHDLAVDYCKCILNKARLIDYAGADCFLACFLQHRGPWCLDL